MTEWITTSLESVATLQRGFDLPTRLRLLGDVPIVGSSGTTGWHNHAMVQGPGVVTGRYGTIGKVFFEIDDFWPLNTTLWISNFHGNDERFIYYLLQRIDFKTHSGKSGVPGVNRNDLHTEPVTLPKGLLDQRAVATILCDVDELIAAMERLIAKKEAIKQGMMQQLLTGKTRLPGFTEPWTEVPLGDHVNYLRTVALSRAQLDSSSPLRYLHYGDIHTRDSVTLNASAEAMPRAPRQLAARAEHLQRGDLVFADASEDPAGVGKSVEIEGVPFEGVVPGLHTIAARFDEAVLAHGFKAYLQFIPEFRSHLLKLAAGTKVLATTRSYVSSARLALPRAAEQQAITLVLRDLECEIVALGARLTKTRAIKTGMMQELLTGRTRLSVVTSA